MDGDAASIVTFLRARYDDEETSTRNLLYWAQQTILTLEEPKLLGTRIPGWHAWPDVERMCQDRLTDLDSKRAILDQYEDARRRSTPGGYDTIDYVEDALDTVVRHLAAPFAAHPDYQESWKP
ncbi:DUF6221 family protein [Micromonospora arborensis]|uniref:DUF6221 family protein n=1 Tax=Micromonospora arborensis TaxID=2116518 RepID=UPI0033CF369D